MFNFSEEEKVFVQNYIISNISGVSKHYDKWNLRCPVCGDSRKSKRKKRGWYYLDTNSYYCFNEGCTASGLFIISKLFNKPIEDVRKEFISTIKHVNNEYSIPIIESPKPQVQDNNIKFLIPNHWVDLPEEVRKYIDNRKILTAPYLPSKNYKFYYNNRNNRLVIPWYKDNNIIYYQERSLDNSIPKYLFPRDMEKQITGLNNLDFNFKYIFIIEGLLDSIFIYNSVPIGGLIPTSRQLTELNVLPFERVYFFDNQWVDEASMKITLKLARQEPNQKIFIWPSNIIEKDVNEYIINNSNNIFLDVNFLMSRIMNGLKILLEFKK